MPTDGWSSGTKEEKGRHTVLRYVDGDALRQVMAADWVGSHQGVELWKLNGKGRFIAGSWDAISLGQ